MVCPSVVLLRSPGCQPVSRSCPPVVLFLSFLFSSYLSFFLSSSCPLLVLLLSFFLSVFRCSSAAAASLSCPLFLFSCSPLDVLPSCFPVVLLALSGRSLSSFCPLGVFMLLSFPPPFVICCPPRAFLWSFCYPAAVVLFMLLSETGAAAAAAYNNQQQQPTTNNQQPTTTTTTTTVLADWAVWGLCWCGSFFSNILSFFLLQSLFYLFTSHFPLFLRLGG